jgi:hypothetical protein
MRGVRAMVAVAVAAAGASLVSVKPVEAFFFGGYNEAWCTIGEMTDCSYFTLQQCLAAASGLGGHCMRNPSRPWPQQEPPRRRHQKRPYN